MRTKMMFVSHRKIDRVFMFEFALTYDVAIMAVKRKKTKVLVVGE